MLKYPKRLSFEFLVLRHPLKKLPLFMASNYYYLSIKNCAFHMQYVQAGKHTKEAVRLHMNT